MNSKNAGNWPVIVHQSLQGSEIIRTLSQTQKKIRFSDSTQPSSVIFPLSSVAFMIVHLNNWKTSHHIQSLYQSIEKFIGIHARCHLLVVSPLFGKEELHMYSQIQIQFIKTPLQILPVHNATEAAQAMIQTATVLCKPANDVMSKRLQGIEREILSNCDVLSDVLKQIGLNPHQIKVIQDSLGSLASIVTADRDDLLDCSLDISAVDKVLTFFGNV